MVTCVTAQNPSLILSVHALPASIIDEQLDSVFSYFKVSALKIGMLFSEEIIHTVASFLSAQPQPLPPLVIDPLMIASSGTRLLNQDALSLFCKKLLPLATLVTPNRPEAEVLAEMSLFTQEDVRKAALKIWRRYGVAVLIKGGHFERHVARDTLYDGTHYDDYETPFVMDLNTHGTGCSLSAAIAANLARGKTLQESTKLAKNYLQHCLESPVLLSNELHLGHSVLDEKSRNT